MIARWEKFLSIGQERPLEMDVAAGAKLHVDCGCWQHPLPWEFELALAGPGSRIWVRAATEGAVFRELDRNGPVAISIVECVSPWRK